MLTSPSIVILSALDLTISILCLSSSCLKAVAAQNVEYYIYMCSPSACLSESSSLLCTCTPFFSLSLSSASPSGSSDDVSSRFPLTFLGCLLSLSFACLRRCVGSCHGAITSLFLIFFCFSFTKALDSMGCMRNRINRI